MTWRNKPLDDHERGHKKTARREGLSNGIVRRGHGRNAIPVVVAYHGNSPKQLRKAARVLEGGGPGGDSKKDKKAAAALRAEADAREAKKGRK